MRRIDGLKRLSTGLKQQINALVIGKAERIFFSKWFAEGGSSTSGQSVTVDSALQLSTVWACVRLLAETISTLPLKLYRRNPDGSRELAVNHPAYRALCVQPGLEVTPSRFMLLVVASIVLRGNAYVRKMRLPSGRLAGLNFMLPQFVRWEVKDNGRLLYKYDDGTTKYEVADVDMMHIRGFGLDAISGLMPINVGREIIGNATAAETTSGKTFANGMNPSGIITTDAKLDAGQREMLRASLERFTGSNNAGKIIIGEFGMKYEGITMHPEAAQLLQTRNHGVEELCRFFRVMPFMVGHTDKQSSWASSVEGMNLIFLTNTLRPMLKNIEDEISRCLLDNSEEYYAEFAVEGLLRADTAGRASWYSTALQNGYMNRNTVARFENLPQIPGGDVYTVQSNLIPLEQLGKMPDDASQARAALRRWLTEKAEDDVTETA